MRPRTLRAARRGFPARPREVAPDYSEEVAPAPAVRARPRVARLDSGEAGVIRLKVVTYNVHKCRGLDGRTSASRIAEVLREIDADVMALQEVLDQQAEIISAELRLPFVLGENRKHRG